MAHVTIELDERTLRLLRSSAEDSDQSIDEVVQAAIVSYVRGLTTLPESSSPAEERRHRIREEAAAWRSLPETERRFYAGAYVAVLSGKVVDSDRDRLALLLRVRRKYADAPILFTPADEDSPREYSRIGLKRA